MKFFSGIMLFGLFPLRVNARQQVDRNGIPDEAVGKIFQPFFTTKPTGVGTGLGLSLSYNIVTAHGGELKLENHEGDGATFTFDLRTDY